MSENKVIIASRNKGKIAEITAVLSKYGMDVISRDDAGLDTFEVEETGETFEENSYIKAKAIMDLTGVATISDDSGLMVDALGGGPGVYSARYAGEGCTYHDNNVKLLGALKDVHGADRSAKFVTVATMLFPDGSKLVARGECPGMIIEELRGEGGFGYDPLFVPDGYDKTFAEMTPEEKNSLSHRAKAFTELEKLLEEKINNK